MNKKIIDIALHFNDEKGYEIWNRSYRCTMKRVRKIVLNTLKNYEGDYKKNIFCSSYTS